MTTPLTLVTSNTEAQIMTTDSNALPDYLMTALSVYEEPAELAANQQRDVLHRQIVHSLTEASNCARSARRRAPDDCNCSRPTTVAEIGTSLSGTSPKPVMSAAGDALRALMTTGLRVTSCATPGVVCCAHTGVAIENIAIYVYTALATGDLVLNFG